MSLSQAATEFLTGRPAGVSAVSRSAGLLASWVENGFNCTVRRDSAGLPYELVAERAGRGLRLTQSFTYSGGVLVGMTGDTIPTVFREEVMGGQSSVSGGGVIATSRAALETDSGGTFGLRTGATYTLSDTSLIPAGVILTAGASGGGTLAVGGSVTINGGTSSITLTARQVAVVLPTDGSATDLTVKVS